MKIYNIEKEFKNYLQSVENKLHSNLKKEQRDIMKLLTNNNNFICVPSNKNLGPVVIENLKYIKLVFINHLDNKNTYTELNET